MTHINRVKAFLPPYYATRCPHCQQEINGRAAKIQGRNWHPDCYAVHRREVMAMEAKRQRLAPQRREPGLIANIVSIPIMVGIFLLGMAVDKLLGDGWE